MNTIPNLSALSMNSRALLKSNPHAPNGVYCLDDIADLAECKSSIIIVRQALQIGVDVTQDDIDALDRFMADDNHVKPTPNAMGGFHKEEAVENEDGSYTLATQPVASWQLQRDKEGRPTGKVYRSRIHRKQATFGAEYDFGQVNTSIMDPELWPRVVKVCLALTKRMSYDKGISGELYNAVHASYYGSAQAWLAPHWDKEDALMKGMPIYSFTFLSGVVKPRPFSIYHPGRNKQTPEKVADVILDNGDLLVMQGSMQDWYLHGVEKPKPASEFQDARRINLTVRAFRPPSACEAKGEQPDAKRARSQANLS